MQVLSEIAQPLLRWYDENKRVLPFRTQPSPYRVWVSEIMLQQTRVSAALPYFERFMAALPTIADLAACPEDKLMKLWEGLGYYSRVRNLQKAARVVVEQHGGELPADHAALRALPGIGDYTAGAIASISFGLPVAAVDGNVLRVFSRLLCDEGDILRPDTKKRMTGYVLEAQPKDRPGDYNQALMELGALVCVPGGPPLCPQCPWQTLCRAHAEGRELTLPVKAKAAARKTLDYTVCLVLRDDTLLLHRRPASGLLAGLWEPVLLAGRLEKDEAAAALAALGLTVKPGAPLRPAKHVFTHLEWHMTGYVCTWLDGQLPDSVWASRAQLEQDYALPGAFKAYTAAAKKLL